MPDVVQGVGESELKAAALRTTKAPTEVIKPCLSNGARADCTLDLVGALGQSEA